MTDSSLNLTPENILMDSDYQSVLVSVFKDYRNNLKEILELATIENNGLRPENLANEIYALFHHISRSLHNSTSIENSIRELEQGKNSHLKRAILDSYKISINGVLKEEVSLADTLDILVLDEDFRSVFADSVRKIAITKKIRKNIKNYYLEAKKHERTGNFADAILNYNNTLDEANRLKNLIQEFQEDRSFVVALQSVEKKKRDIKSQRRFSILIMVLSIMLTGIVTSLGTLWVTKMLRP